MIVEISEGSLLSNPSIRPVVRITVLYASNANMSDAPATTKIAQLSVSDTSVYVHDTYIMVAVGSIMLIHATSCRNHAEICDITLIFYDMHGGVRGGVPSPAQPPPIFPSSKPTVLKCRVLLRERERKKHARCCSHAKKERERAGTTLS